MDPKLNTVLNIKIETVKRQITILAKIIKNEKQSQYDK